MLKYFHRSSRQTKLNSREFFVSVNYTCGVHSPHLQCQFEATSNQKVVFQSIVVNMSAQAISPCKQDDGEGYHVQRVGKKCSQYFVYT